MPDEKERVELISGLLALGDSDRVIVEVLSQHDSGSTTWTGRQVIGAAETQADWIRARAIELGRPPLVGLLAENSAEWIIADLAILFAGAVEIPVPTAFSAGQASSLLAEADICLADSVGIARLQEWRKEGAAPVLPGSSQLRHLDAAVLVGAAHHEGIHGPSAEPTSDAIIKIIHTSGTTSAPKGVKIRLHAIEALITSLQARSDQSSFQRYLSIVPLSLLIEQVAGLYVPLLSGGQVTFLPPGTSLVGTAADAGVRMVSHLRAARPTAMVFPPTMAGLLLTLCEQAPDEDVSARHRRIFGHDGPVFIACGGAPVPIEILHRLDMFGITLYEGYGLSENSSVVSWNFPGNLRFGTVGRPLDHVEVRLADDGELLVRSTSLFAGYSGTDPSSLTVDADGWLNTGDLADIDPDGFIRIIGRKKNILITAGGRNLSPEWIEAEYRQLPFVRESVVVADALDTVHGLFVIDSATSDEQARNQIEQFGKEKISDIERVSVIQLMSEDDSEFQTYFTITGRPRRDRVRTLLLGESE